VQKIANECFLTQLPLNAYFLASPSPVTLPPGIFLSHTIVTDRCLFGHHRGDFGIANDEAHPLKFAMKLSLQESIWPFTE
jgi:hypothetical protein